MEGCWGRALLDRVKYEIELTHFRLIFGGLEVVLGFKMYNFRRRAEVISKKFKMCTTKRNTNMKCLNPSILTRPVLEGPS